MIPGASSKEIDAAKNSMDSKNMLRTGVIQNETKIKSNNSLEGNQSHDDAILFFSTSGDVAVDVCGISNFECFLL